MLPDRVRGRRAFYVRLLLYIILAIATVSVLLSSHFEAIASLALSRHEIAGFVIGVYIFVLAVDAWFTYKKYGLLPNNEYHLID